MYRVDIDNNANFEFKVKCKDYEFLVDTNGKGITPPDTLLAGLGSCVGVYIRKYAESASIPLPGFRLRLEAEFSKDLPVCFRKIKVTIDLKGTNLDERRKYALLEFIKNCPVHNTLKSNPQVDFSLV